MKVFLAVAALVLLGLAVWQLSPTPSDSTGEAPPEAPRDPRDTEPGGVPEPPPAPENPAARLFSEERTGEASARPRLRELAKTKKGVQSLIELLPTLRDPEDRAILFLLLVTGGTTEGLDFALKSAGGADSPYRIPAILGLAGGDDRAVSELVRLLEETEDGPLLRALSFALALNGSDPALHALERALAATEDVERRLVLYEGLSGTPADVPAGDRFRALFGRETPSVQDRPGFRGLVDRLARESDPGAMGVAATILAGLPGPDARAGVIDLWRRAEGPVRESVFDAMLGSWSEARPGAARSLIAVALEAGGEEDLEHRRRILDRLREARSTELIPLLEEWRAKERDPDLAQSLEIEIRRLREEQ